MSDDNAEISQTEEAPNANANNPNQPTPSELDMQDNSTKLKHYHALGFRDAHCAKIVQHMDNDEEVSIFGVFEFKSKRLSTW
jgi:hypothetical protein